MSRVLVVSYDAIGPRMAGGGIRAYELSRELGREHEVVLASEICVSHSKPPLRV